MKKIFVLLLGCMALSCSNQKPSPLDGRWSMLEEDTRLHVYTFDDGWVGFGAEMCVNSKNKSATFGEIVFTSDSTAIMKFREGFEQNIKFSLADDNNGLFMTIANRFDTYLRSGGPLDYKENAEENAFRSGIRAMRKKK